MLFTQIQLRPTCRWDYFSLLVPALGRASAEAYLVARILLGPQSARPGRRNLECRWLFKSVVLKTTFLWISCYLKSKQPVSSSWLSLLGWVTNISSNKRTELTLSSVNDKCDLLPILEKLLFKCTKSQRFSHAKYLGASKKSDPWNMTTRGVFLLRLKMLCKPLDKKLFCFPFFSLTKPVSEGWWWKCWQNALAAKSFRVRY